MNALRNQLDETIRIYDGKLNAERYASAGEDYSNVDHASEYAKVPDVDSAMVAALKKIGISNKDDLATEFKLNGIEYPRLMSIQTPYFFRKAETAEELKDWSSGLVQTENSAYAKPYKGFGFDDVYAVLHMFDVLPDNNDSYTINYGFYKRWVTNER